MLSILKIFPEYIEVTQETIAELNVLWIVDNKGDILS